MAKDEAKKRIEKLKKLINRHRYLYHVLDRQEISEAALDSLKKELFDLEQKFPELITPDSPTQRIGGKPLGKFRKVRHSQSMLSFNDAFSEVDMEDWIKRNSKILTKEEVSRIDYFCEPKLDGLAIELIYEARILKVGATRGDGQIGEDVTQNLKTIESVPLKLREIEEIEISLKKENLKEIAENIRKNGLKEVVVRAEAIITKKDFVAVNKEQKKQGLPSYANPRNLAAGSIRQLDPKVTSQRRLEVSTYGLISDFGQKTHLQEHKILQALGFKTNNKHTKCCKNLQEVFEFYRYWLKNREKLPYEIDGIVVNINQNSIFKKLGVVGKAPRGAIAFKFPLKEATTVVEAISVQVGRTGVLTPVAHLKPVKVGGVIISRATLHNEDEIKRLGLKIGDTVIVGRAGDVIPDIIKVLTELRTGKEREFKMPAMCPACQTKVTKQKGEALWRCPNPKCSALQKRFFYHFISRGAFDIVGLGPKVVDKLIDAGLVSDPADLFKLEIGDILPLESLPRRPRSFRKKGGALRGFAEKSAENLVKSIQPRKKISLAKFIYALGIRNVGEETARDLAEYFGTIEKLQKASLENLQKITDIGPVVAKSIQDWFSQKINLEFLKKLKKAGVEIIIDKGKKYQPLKGKTFVLTGALEKMARDEVKEKIRLLGGEVSESVSENTDYLVVGKKPGSKLDAAKKLDIKIISEKEFLTIFQK